MDDFLLETFFQWCSTCRTFSLHEIIGQD